MNSRSGSSPTQTEEASSEAENDKKIYENSDGPSLSPEELLESSSKNEDKNVKNEDFKDQQPEGWWMTKPCFFYREEYRDCRRIRARFHQYFINGQLTDCSQWKIDYNNCTLWNDKRDREAFVKVIDSERQRVRERLRAHLGNDTWTLRSTPPKEWDQELPDFIQKGYEGSFLKAKAHELKNGLPTNDEISFWDSKCIIS